MLRPLLFCLFVILSGRFPPGATPERIAHVLQADEGFRLTQNTPPLLARLRDLGEVDGSIRLSHLCIHFAPTDQQQKDLTALLKRQLDRSSQDYRQWLIPEEFADRFGLNVKDLEKVENWLLAQGFNIVEPARSRTHIKFSGTASQVKAALGTPIHKYMDSGGEVHYSNASDPLLPLGLRSIVSGIRGLHNFKPHRAGQRARFTYSFPNGDVVHFLWPDDLATIYDLKPLFGAGVNGTGQSIAIAGQAAVDIDDIRTFRARGFLPASDPLIAYNQPFFLGGSDEEESELDVEVASEAAPGATIILALDGEAFDSATTAVDNNLAPVLSISYSECEADVSRSELNALSTVFQQANAQGITVIADTGDTGPANCDYGGTIATQGFGVGIPASFPTVTAVGGTEFNEGSGHYWSSTNNSSGGSALSYIPEMAWNDSQAFGLLEASGGGKSILFSKPDWQKGVNVPNDKARDLPDVSFTAAPQHDSYGGCLLGECSGTLFWGQNNRLVPGGGGTSASTPFFAGLVALLNQKEGARVGNVNPELYTLASFSPDAFHDVTIGNNNVPCRASSTNCPAAGTIGYSAGPGYDLVTGLGSVDAYNLLEEWGADFSLNAAPASVTLAAGATGSANVTIDAENHFSGVVLLTCSVPKALSDVSCSGSTSVTGSGTAAFTISRAAKACSPFFWNSLRLWGLYFIGSISLVLAGMRPRAIRFRMAFVVMLLLFAGLTLTACGSGSASSNGLVTANVVITATSGNLSHASPITVTTD